MKFFLMKTLFSKSFRISLLLGLLLSPTQNWCAAAAEHEKTTALTTVTESVGTAVRNAYALKHTISSVNEKDPVKALSASTALALLSATDVQLHMYGTFTTVPDPKNPGRTMKVFTTNPPTTLNEITRSMLDVLDDKLNATIQESNPFSGLEAHTIAKMVKVLEKSGVTGLLKQLRKELGIAEPKQDTRGKKGKGNDQSTTTVDLPQEEIMPDWTKDWNAKANPVVQAPPVITIEDWDEKTNPEKQAPPVITIEDWDENLKATPKKKYSLTEFTKKIKAFVNGQNSLEKLNSEAKTDLEKAKVTEIFSKLLMNFLYAKDQKESGTTKGTHSIVDYYSALLGIEFKPEYYTTEELEQIGKALLGQDSTYTIGKDAKGIEGTTAYLSHFVAGDIAFLQAPYSIYSSPGKTFAYCAEATIRSIMNSLLYNPETGKLDITMLPQEKQKTMGQTSLGQKFKDFIEKYPDPTTPNYYGNSLEEWLDIVSGLEGVKYNKGKGANAYEISAGAGPENLVAVMNHIFGTKADSFKALGTAMKVEDKHGAITRTVSFTPNDGGFDLDVTDHGKIIIQADVKSSKDTHHVFFAIKGKKIIIFLKLMVWLNLGGQTINNK